MKIENLKKQGWTNKGIGKETGFRPVTIAKHLAAGGPPTKRSVPDEALVMNQHWQTRIDQLLRKWPRLLGISVFCQLRAEGFTGGYSMVTHQLREVRGPGFQAVDRASVPIHTDPGEEAQFDFCDAHRLGGPLGLVGALVLSWDDLVLESAADLVVHHLTGPILPVGPDRDRTSPPGRSNKKFRRVRRAAARRHQQMDKG